jgi:hypothetical protein
MWTKQYSSTGKVFYYNSSQNLSMWHAPIDSVVHEALHIKSPTDDTSIVSDTSSANYTAGHYSPYDYLNYNHMNSVSNSGQVKTDAAYLNTIVSASIVDDRFEYTHISCVF